MDILNILNIEKASSLNNNNIKKKKKNDDEEEEEEEGSGGVDRISELPDEVLVHVLSFVPLRTAAATSVLSRRWIHLWKQVPNLNFDDLGPYTQLSHLFIMPPDYYSIPIPTYKCERSQFCMRKYIDWVNSVIESYDKSHSYPLQEFSIVALVDKPNQHQATKWLEFAFSRRVEKLKLISNEYWFSACVLADMLKGMSIPPRSRSSGFTSLKVLWLKSFKTSGDAIEFLLRSCPMLETLVLDRLRVTTDLEVVGSSMKHLDISCAQYCADSVRIRAPDLTWLTIDHDTMIVSLENVPKLVNMAIHCYSNMHGIRDFARVARQLETLIIFLTNPEVTFSVPEMPNLKKLVVCHRSHRSEDLFPVTRFMRAAPALEDFRIDVVELGVRRQVFRIPKDDQGHNEHRHLRRFVLSGFCWDHIQLLRYVVNYCTALEEIVIGQCNRDGLVREFVDYCVPLRHIIPPIPIYKYHVATPQERQEINKRVRLFTPSRIKLRVV